MSACLACPWVAGGDDVTSGSAAAPPVAPDAENVAESEEAAQRRALEAALDEALTAGKWAALPEPIIGVHHSGPTPSAAPGAPPGPVWYITRGLSPNDRPSVDERAERAFVSSVEAAHARKTRLIVGGVIVLVDPAGRAWAVAAHTPHLLRCYDGKGWTFKRADGLPAAADEPAAFARLAAEGKLPDPRYAKDGLRDLNDMGRWYSAACADAAGNLHVLASCVSSEAETRPEGGGGVHTLRPDGTWAFFRIYPPDMPRYSMALDGLRCVLHARVPAAPAGPAAAKPEAEAEAEQDPEPATAEEHPGAAGGEGPVKPEGAAADLVTVAEFRLSDPIAEAHGHAVEPIPPGSDELRRQQWKDRTDEPRHGPVYLLRFDGRTWRFDRSSVGWGVYDAVYQAWPQPDGRVYLANRFGLWVQWPEAVAKARLDGLIADLFDVDADRQNAAATTLVSMGRLAAPALRQAVEAASSERARGLLGLLADQAEKVARGEEDAVPAVDGEWQFFGAAPQATMPDGRFAFHCNRAVNVRTGAEIADVLVFFDPAAAAFNMRAIDRAQWNATDFADKRALEPPVKSGTVVDLGHGLWVPGGFRCGADGRIQRVVPPGFKLDLPGFVDPDGRVYFRSDRPNQMSLHVFRPDAPAGAAAPVVERPDHERELHVEHVRAVFRQPDLAPPWNAWAVQSRPGKPDLLLRLDGPAPTRVDPPVELRHVAAVVPLERGCVAVGPGAAGFWDGDKWDVAPDVKGLTERHGKRFAETAPTRVFAADTSDFAYGHLYRHQLLLASDGRGGLWLAEDVAPPQGGAGGNLHGRSRNLWHWDGTNFTDLWTLLPLQPQRDEDGAVMTADGGRALIVHVEPNLDVRPGGHWAVWRVTPDDLTDPAVVPQAVNRPGLHPRLLAALGPNTTFTRGLWVDRQGWVWSPLFSDSGHVWARRRDARIGYTPIDRFSGHGSLQQGRAGPTWWVSGKMRDEPMAWVDVADPPGEEPATFSRMRWAGAHVPGMGAAAQVAVAPDDQVYLLHEGGCSLLRLRKLGEGERPKLAVRIIDGHQVGEQPAEQAGGVPRWEIQEVAHREWDGPRNDFSRVAFDESGVWFLPTDGPLIRAPLPRE